jgi:alpha-beta hydrolase superfamily lysophospholipase
MRVFHCTWAILAILAAPGLAQAPGDANYLIFLRGTPIGREEMSIRSSPEGVTVSSHGSAAAPLSTVARNAELRYAPDGNPRSYSFEGSINGIDVSLNTTFANGTATTKGLEAGKPVTMTQPIPPKSVVLPSGLFSGFATLSARLTTASVGDVLSAYAIPGTEMPARVVSVSNERMQKSTSLFDVKRFELAFGSANDEVMVQVTSLPSGELVRVTIPSQALDVLREDIASVSSRADVYSNPGDQPVVIPAAGFNVGATLTMPRSVPDVSASGGGARRPAVVLVSSPDSLDRDSIASGVPAFGQLAGALADAGFVALRYDLRGTGQSGGRTESAGLADYAEDVRTLTKWLSSRKDIDPKRIALIGHDTGAWVALLAASKDKRVAATVSIAAPAAKGVDFVLEQQQLQLERMRTPAADRQAKIALQQRIDSAVLTGKGWEGIAPELRRRADTPWFQSVLAFDPGKVAHDVDEPILIVHGEVDREVPVAHANRLASAARKGDRDSVTVDIVPGVNHLLQNASTGSLAEYATLSGKGVSPDVVARVVGWLQRTLRPSR